MVLEVVGAFVGGYVAAVLFNTLIVDWIRGVPARARLEAATLVQKAVDEAKAKVEAVITDVGFPVRARLEAASAIQKTVDDAKTKVQAGIAQNGGT